MARQRIAGDRTPLEIGQKVHGGRAISNRFLDGRHYGDDRLRLVDPRLDQVLRRQIAKEEIALERYPIWRSWALRLEQIYNGTHLDPSSPW